MRRFIVLLLAMSCAAVLPGQARAQTSNDASRDGVPSVTDPSVPLSYVGNDGSVSLGVNREGQTEGQLLGVFARNNERAVIGQLWWDRAGAGGLQTDFNWLWGVTAQEAREHPDAVTVARLSFALDQSADHDRKATLGFGIERREFSLEGYLARAITGARSADSTFQRNVATLNGIDDIGSYTQVEVSTIETLFARKPYGVEAGFQLSHVFEPLALRVHGGASTQSGDGARASTFSAGFDTPLGTRGWGLSALAEHVARSGLDSADDDDRVSVFLRYEFGSHGSFVPTSELEDPAWIARSLGRPSSAHPRVVETHRVRRTQSTEITRDPKQYTNRFPLAHDDIANVVSGQAISIDVLTNDSDPDNDPLAVSAVTQPLHGSASIAGARILYTPVAGFVGSDSFRYTASDGRGGSASAQVTVNLGARPNQVPLARDDNAVVTFGQSITIDVLANDSDPDGDTLSIASVGAPTHGSARVAGRSVTYTPAQGFSGSDRFTYTIADGHGGSATATVTIAVAPRPNRAPVARNDTATAAFGVPVSIAVLANDTDPDGDTLQLVSATAPANGTATIAGVAILYTPAPGFSGADSFSYTIRDGRGGSATATVTITVSALPNRPPVAINDVVTVPFGQATVLTPLSNDSDPDNDPLTLVSITAPNGTAVISGNSVIYTPPAAGAAGIDTFTYTISDGRGGSATATVTITIAPAPNRPPVAVNDTLTAVLGQANVLTPLANDSDPDNDTLTLSSVTVPLNGTAVISGNSVIYTPGPGAATTGFDSFSYTIGDGRGGTASATVTITFVPPPNNPPIAVDDVGAPTANSQPRTIPVLANDSDPDGDPLTIVSITTPTNGSALISGASVIYTSAAGFGGTDSFTYTISDGRGGTATATVTIVVIGPVPNPIPVAVADPVTTPADAPLTIVALSRNGYVDRDRPISIGFAQPIASAGHAVVSAAAVRHASDAS